LVQQLKQRDALVSEGATCGESLWKSIDRVVFIDSTWNQTHSILRVRYGFLSVCGVCTYEEVLGSSSYLSSFPLSSF